MEPELLRQQNWALNPLYPHEEASINFYPKHLYKKAETIWFVLIIDISSKVYYANINFSIEGNHL